MTFNLDRFRVSFQFSEPPESMGQFLLMAEGFLNEEELAVPGEENGVARDLLRELQPLEPRLQGLQVWVL